MLNDNLYRYMVKFNPRFSPITSERLMLVRWGYIVCGKITPIGRAAMLEYEEAVGNA